MSQECERGEEQEEIPPRRRTRPPRITKKQERRVLAKAIRLATGLPFPVAQRLAKGVVKSGASGFHFDYRTPIFPGKPDVPGSTARLAADAVVIETVPNGCRCCGWRIDAIYAEGPKGRYYFEGLPSK